MQAANHSPRMREGEGDGTTFFRKQVQTTIQAIKQFIQDAFSVAPTARDIGTQTHELNQPFASKSSDDRSPANSEDPPSIVSAEFVNKKDPNLTESETERENSVSSAQDTARWLYAFLSGDITTYSLNAENLLVSTMVSESTKIHETGTIDRLLRSWSRLKDDKIRDLQDAKELPRPSEGENDAATKRRSHDYAFVRASMQQIVSKALSYAQHSKSHESLSSKRDSQHHDVQRAPREDGNDKRAMRVSIHAKEVEVEHLQEDKWHSEAQHEGSAERKTTPPPPQHRAASRHRSKSASWVLGHRRVRSQSSDGRVTTAPTSVSTNNPSSSGLSYARTIGWKKSHQTSRSLDSPVVRISSSTTSIDKCVPQQTPDRSSHCPPPQKVLFTTPVARIASPSTVGLSSTSSTSTITTAKNASIGSSITKPSSPPLQPAKGILKPPTHHFPEELNPIREGVTLHKLDRMNKDAPPGAKWTKIKRSWVNPEALTMGKERFEVLGDHVKVLRVLSRDEIEAYRIATAQLRAMREDGPKEDEDRSQKKKGSGDGADKRDGADGRRQSPPSRYVGQRSGGRMGKKGSPSPPHRREDGKVP